MVRLAARTARIKYAENPPKKYEDIVNVHFYRGALPSIWYELRDIVLFWVGHGVKIFRVDNPHTKPVPFWEWMIREVLDRHPDVIFLAEAFTRPKMMRQLAKVGFTQSYSYFTWRNTKQELTEYLTELTQDEPKEYMRPNFFANTPDINPVYLQTSGRPGFQVRLVLAATLSTVYGIYNGFELCEGTPIPGKEEYLDSEKYEIKAWDYDRPGNIRDYITRLNQIRRDNPALQEFTNLRFYNAWNDHILYYGKMTAAKDNIVLIAVNLDPHHAPGGHLRGAAVGARPAGLGRRRGRGPAHRPAASPGTARSSRSGSIRRSTLARSGGSCRPVCRAERASGHRRGRSRDDRSQRSAYGTRTPSSISCTSRRSSMPTTTASATSPG